MQTHEGDPLGGSRFCPRDAGGAHKYCTPIGSANCRSRASGIQRKTVEAHHYEADADRLRSLRRANPAVCRGIPDSICSPRDFLILTRSGHVANPVRAALFTSPDPITLFEPSADVKNSDYVWLASICSNA